MDSLPGTVSADDVLLEAIKAYRNGNLDGAEGLTAELIASGFQHRLIYVIAGHISLAVNEFDRATSYFKLALQQEPSAHEIQRLLQKTELLKAQFCHTPQKLVPRYLLIREWTCGFCSDLNHVLGSLLLAEMTNRIPIVYWGDASKFRDEGDTNAWNNFFRPVSVTEPDELLRDGLSYFPSKWNKRVLLRSDSDRLNRHDSAVAGFRVLNVPEDVAVTDVHIGIVDLAPWIRPESPLANHSIEELYRFLVAKYIRLVPSLAGDVETFWNRSLAGRAPIAVHVRGGDKFDEIAEHESANKEIFQSTLAMAKRQPDSAIFLLTDDLRIRAKYVEAFGNRIVTTDCRRVAADEGIHRVATSGKRQLGEEIVRDMFLAARCDFFIGAGSTNVASMIAHLKAWPQEALILHGLLLHESRNFFALRVFR